MNDVKKRRRAREYQARSRGDRRSCKSELEAALLLLCREHEMLSEGQIAKMLNIGILDVRFKLKAMLEEGMRIAEALKPLPPPPEANE